MSNHVSQKALNLFGWLDQITVLNFPLSITTDPTFLRYSNLERISYPTLIKIMTQLCKRVEGLITKEMEQFPKIGLMFDGWGRSHLKVHYTAVLGVYDLRDSAGMTISFIIYSFSRFFYYFNTSRQITIKAIISIRSVTGSVQSKCGCAY